MKKTRLSFAANKIQKKRKNTNKTRRNRPTRVRRVAKDQSVFQDGGANLIYPGHRALEVKGLAEDDLEDFLDVDGL